MARDGTPDVQFMDEPTSADSAPADGPGSTQSGRRNYLLGIANGALGRAGSAFIDPHLVLSAFVYEETKSALWVGVLVTLAAAGSFWPQLYMSSLIEHRPRKNPFYVGAAVVRVATLLAMVAAMLLVGATESGWPMVLFFLSFFAFKSAQGAGVLPFYDVVGQTIRLTRLGGFFALRSLFGDTLALLCGFLVLQPIIAHLSFPVSYALLAGISLVLLGAGWGMWCLAHEEENQHPPKKRRLRQTLTEGARMVRTDRNYRNLLLIKSLVRVCVLALAFYVPYGVERLGAVGLGGVFIGLISASRLVSSLLWGRVSDRRGNRPCLMWAGLLFALSPAAALLAPRLPQLFRLDTPVLLVQMDMPLCVYLMSLCFLGFALQANMIGVNALLIESAPKDKRPSYIAFINTVAFPLAFLPAVAGVLVGDRPFAFDILFVVIAASGLLYFRCALGLSEIRGQASKVG